MRLTIVLLLLLAAPRAHAVKICAGELNPANLVPVLVYDLGMDELDELELMMYNFIPTLAFVTATTWRSRRTRFPVYMAWDPQFFPSHTLHWVDRASLQPLRRPSVGQAWRDARRHYSELADLTWPESTEGAAALRLPKLEPWIVHQPAHHHLKGYLSALKTLGNLTQRMDALTRIQVLARFLNALLPNDIYPIGELGLRSLNQIAEFQIRHPVSQALLMTWSLRQWGFSAQVRLDQTGSDLETPPTEVFVEVGRRPVTTQINWRRSSVNFPLIVDLR